MWSGKSKRDRGEGTEGGPSLEKGDKEGREPKELAA